MEINHEISLETEIPLQSIQNFVMHWEVNEHAELELDGVLEEDSWDTVWSKDYAGTEVTVLLADTIEQNGDGVLFRGLVQDLKLFWNHGVGMAHVRTASASIKLDGDNQRQRHSFQNPSMKYSDVAKQITETGNGKIIYTTTDKEIAKPIICYQETVWEFLKRLASYQGSFLIPDTKTGRPNLWYGMRTGKQIKVNALDETIEIDIQKGYDKSERGKTIKTYCLECRTSYALGDWMSYNGKKLVIYAMKAQMMKGDILFSYKMAYDKDIIKKTYYNEMFTGMSLWGRVEEVKDETVRVTFDIDGEEGKWYYPWRPETGNALYAMPEIGAKVSVNFMNHDDGAGIAVRCLGQSGNGESKDKSVTTPGEGKIELFHDCLNIRKKGEKMEIKDSSSFNFRGKQIEIEANGKVKIHAKKLSLRAASEIKATTE